MKGVRTDTPVYEAVVEASASIPKPTGRLITPINRKSVPEESHSAADAGSGQPPPPYNCFLNSVGDMPAFCLKNRAKWLG